jgi:2-keto-4-pentenoate hydratase/2-oxohepta-3-ene-1,7-dioic acid hydratase in catechol pathway
MNIVKYETETTEGPKPGLLADNVVYDVESSVDGSPSFATVLERVTVGDFDGVAAALDEGEKLDRSAVRLHPPVADSGRVFCFGAVYTGHMEEEELSLTFDPNQWVMPENAIVGPEDPIVLPERVASDVMPAAELALVIGTGGKYIDPMDAYDHLAGYTVSNDVTARTDWPGPMGYKMLDSFSPVGPSIRTIDEVGDPTDLDIEIRQDGEVTCRGSTAGMRFTLSFLVSYLSAITELRPGDVISTGDPGGVDRSLEPDSTVELEIESVGTLSNEVVRESDVE